jgi:hypothetical protein
MPQSIVIPGLTTVDRRELEDALSETEVSFDESEVRSGDFGELATIIATVIVTRITLAILAIWVSKKVPAREVAGRKRYFFRQKITANTADGTKETVIEVEGESKEALQEGVAKQLAGLFQLDVAAVLDAVKSRG